MPRLNASEGSLNAVIGEAMRISARTWRSISSSRPAGVGIPCTPDDDPEDMAAETEKLGNSAVCMRLLHAGSVRMVEAVSV